MNLQESKNYWNKKIIEWENASYRGGGDGVGFIERFASRFRGPIKRRRKILLDLIKDRVGQRTVLELGCGSGDLCFKILSLGAHKVIGIDIAEEAIKAARAKAINLGLKNKAEFLVADVRGGGELPDADLVIGLGFIDYIDISNLKRLLAGIKGEFIFSFPEKKMNLINILQYLYLKSQGCTSFYKFKREEFNDLPAIGSKCLFFSADGMTFITNFDPARH